MERVPWTRRRVPARVVVQIFAIFATLLALAAAQGWRVNYLVFAAMRATGAIEARFREDPRFADLKITRSTGGSITVSGRIPSPRDLLDLRSLVQSTAPATRTDYSIHVGGKWVSWFPQPDRFEAWMQHELPLVPNERDATSSVTADDAVSESCGAQ